MAEEPGHVDVAATAGGARGALAPVLMAGGIGAGMAIIAVAFWYAGARPPGEPAMLASAAPPRAEGAETAATATTTVRPPRFDTLRHGAAGDTLVAGHAAPGASVAILIEGREIARVQADASGAFVAMFDLPQEAGPRVVSLAMDLPDGETVMAAQSVILAPRAEPSPPSDVPHIAAHAEPAPVPVSVDAGDGVAVTAREEASDPAVTEQVADGAETALHLAHAGEPAPEGPLEPPLDPQIERQPEIQPQPEAQPERSLAAAPAVLADPAAPAVLLADEEGIRLMAPAERPSNVVIDTIGYDGEGDVHVSGRATGSGHVRLYLDNREQGTATVAPDGTWTTDLPGTTGGIYTLRIDELDEKGEVTSRFETPFQREDPDLLARVAVDGPDDGTEVRVITVQPGFTLWGIARSRYGQGIEYVRVYEANRSQIRDPDLIYPGQVFEIPDL